MTVGARRITCVVGRQAGRRALDNPVSASRMDKTYTNHTRSTVRITLGNIFRSLSVVSSSRITHSLSRPADVYTSRSPDTDFFEQFVRAPPDDGRHGSKNVQERGEVIWWLLRKLE